MSRAPQSGRGRGGFSHKKPKGSANTNWQQPQQNYRVDDYQYHNNNPAQYDEYHHDERGGYNYDDRHDAYAGWKRPYGDDAVGVGAYADERWSHGPSNRGDYNYQENFETNEYTSRSRWNQDSATNTSSAASIYATSKQTNTTDKAKTPPQKAAQQLKKSSKFSALKPDPTSSSAPVPITQTSSVSPVVNKIPIFTGTTLLLILLHNAYLS